MTTRLILVALAMVMLVLFLQYPLQRIVAFRRRHARPRTTASELFPKLRRQRYTASMAELRDFASSLLLGTSMDVTLSQALQKTAELFSERGVFGERLGRHVESRMAESPEAVLKALARDFASEHLDDMIRRIEISRETGGSLIGALQLTVEAIEEDIGSAISRQIREAANKLTIPMIMGVFFSIVVLGVLPLLLNFMDSFG